MFVYRSVQTTMSPLADVMKKLKTLVFFTLNI